MNLLESDYFNPLIQTEEKVMFHARRAFNEVPLNHMNLFLYVSVSVQDRISVFHGQ
jgi:hypothetical protein